MRKVIVFNSVSIDGYFTDAKGDMSWAHKNDAEWTSFASSNASGGGELVFGRVTYEMMASHWPTPEAKKSAPAIAEGMNASPKIVFSKTLDKVTWQNTRLVKSDPAAEIRKAKNEPGKDLVIMGSGTLISQLTQARLIDEYHVVLVPIVLGAGRTMFEGMKDKLPLKLRKTRPFSNGNVVLYYDAAM
jgi:dihydrofolate reductase